MARTPGQQRRHCVHENARCFGGARSSASTNAGIDTATSFMLRIVPLGGGRYLAMSRELRKKKTPTQRRCKEVLTGGTRRVSARRANSSVAPDDARPASRSSVDEDEHFADPAKI